MMLQEFTDRHLKDFNENALIRIFKIFTAAAGIIILYAFIFSGFQIVDEFEHLHASWLVSIGKVPYKDFFEHHHPLLWYVSAPLVGAFYNQVAIFYVMRGISVLVSLATFFYLYKTALLFTSKTGAWLAVALGLGNLVTLYNFYQFRPDNFMNCGFIIGIYYWFCYLRALQPKLLVFSFLAFTLSFLFLQKIALSLIVVEGLLLLLIIAKKMQLAAVIRAAVPSLAVLGLFFVFLYANGILNDYLIFNLHFNQAMVAYFARGAFWYGNLFFTFYGAALLAGVCFYRRQNILYKLAFILYAAEFFMRAYYFAPHPNYYTLLTLLAALVCAPAAAWLFPRHKIWTIASIVLLFAHLGFLFNRIDASAARHNSFEHYKLAEYVHQNSAPDDILMNGYDKNFNIYRPDASYYWFGLDMLLPIMDLEYHLTNKPDVNALIMQYRPKFIYVKDYPDLRAYRTYGESKFTQVFIPELVQKFYAQTPFEYLAVRK